VYRLPSHPDRHGPGAKLPIVGHTVSHGGQVATTLCTCAAMGLSTAYLGAFGNDDAGGRIRAEIVRRGVDTQHAVVREVANRYAVILIDQRNGERVVLWHRDPQLRLRDGEVVPAVVQAARLLHVDGVDEDVAIRAAGLGRDAGMAVTCDIDRVTPLTPALVAAVTVPIFAEHIPSALTGEPDDERGLRSLRQHHDGVLCVTLGSRGAMMLDGDRLHHAPAFPVNVVDSTGAGDVFRGAFIAAMLRGDRPEAILRFANAAAAISCTREGAIAGVPTLQEVEALSRR
jgi:sugar/nucleoside kinase (ribokinase family)